MHKISVIVPVYNTAEYLPKCLDSIINQTINHELNQKSNPIEVIIVNDGSKDNSSQIIADYSNKYTYIKGFNKENGGLSDARNFGIERAKGKYLSFVDSDDWIAPEMLETLYLLAEKYQADISFCSLQKVNENGKVIKLLAEAPNLKENINLREDFSIFGETSCFACNKIFKRTLFDKVRFVKSIHFEDIATVPQVFLQSKIIAKSNEAFYKYLERTNSISRAYNEKGLDIFKAIKEVKNAFFISEYKDRIEDWKKFVILQGFYSFIAYYAFVKSYDLKRKMFKDLQDLMKKENISKKDLLFYRRYDKLYLNSLNCLKAGYYLFNIIRI